MGVLRPLHDQYRRDLPRAGDEGQLVPARASGQSLANRWYLADANGAGAANAQSREQRACLVNHPSLPPTAC
jgi:hypothetical protein